MTLARFPIHPANASLSRSHPTCDTLAEISQSWPVFREETLTRSLSLSLTLAMAGFAATLPFPTRAQQTSVAAKTTSAKKTVAISPAAAAPPATITVNGITDIDPTKTSGQKNAPLIMEVFTDFQCPACKQLYTTTL